MRVYFVEWNADYGKLMIENLAKSHDVKLINHVLRNYKSLNKKIPWEFFKNAHNKLHCWLKFKHIGKNDLIVCNGYSTLPLIKLLSHVPSRKIVVLRDTIEKLNTNMMAKGLLGPNKNYLDEISNVFDKIYSFDQGDCNIYNLNYLPPFLSFTSDQYDIKSLTRATNKVCYYVGAHDNYREEKIKEIYNLIKNYGYDIDFNLISKDEIVLPPYCKNKKIDYFENLSKTQHAEVLVEINRPGQIGLTLRALEALFYNKKLITTNLEINKLPFYDQDRIFIWGQDNPEKLHTFLNKAIPPVDPQVIENYTADAMLKKIIE